MLGENRPLLPSTAVESGPHFRPARSAVRDPCLPESSAVHIHASITEDAAPSEGIVSSTLSLDVGAEGDKKGPCPLDPTGSACHAV